MTSSASVWIAALMLVVSVALFVAAPLTEVFSPRGDSRDEELRRARLEHERGLAITAMRDLDFDHAMGKIADEEYQTLRAELETRALNAMAALDDGINATASSAPTCPQCGTPTAADHRFCPLCGTASPMAGSDVSVPD
jgi:hypothetical protein